MQFDRFLIAPFESGLRTNVKPFLIPEDAFERLDNAYVFRGRVRKRFGSRYLGTSQTQTRLRINVGTTAAITGNFGPFVVPGTIWKLGQAFSIGTTIFYVIDDTPGAQPMLSTGVATGTFDVATGTVTITGNAENPATTVYFYPAEPVMGFTQYETTDITNNPSFAFDTQFAYRYTNPTGWEQFTTPLWHGTNANFFYTANWHGNAVNQSVLFVSNFFVANPTGAGTVQDDFIWYYDGATWTQINTAPTAFYFRPTGAPNTGPFVVTARIILPFKDRLVLLNTIENNNGGGFGGGTNTQYPQRCRYSFNGSPLATNAWYEPNTTNGTLVAAGGGFIDAPTQEQIVGAEYIKDRLIVYFERSTWELVYTGNQVLPFVWQQINTELGSLSTFSTIPFDKVVLGLGETGVHACSGANVERIDNAIPDTIFTLRDRQSGVERVWGIRDFFNEMVYWSFPVDNRTAASDSPYPNKILVYNYQANTWSFNDDAITAFGYFQQQSDVTWASTTLTWDNYSATWKSGVQQAQFRQIIGGNQEGFTFIIDGTENRNAPAMQITNITILGGNVAVLTIVDHSLTVGDYITVENAQGISQTAGRFIYQVFGINSNDEILLDVDAGFTGVYTGGGTSARVSRIDILSKQWNPYLSKGRNVYVQKIDFGVTRTPLGQVTIDYSPSSSSFSMVQAGQNSGSIVGTSSLTTAAYVEVPFESLQDRVWHPLYFQTDGECIQIRVYLNNDQMIDTDKALSEFTLEGMVLTTTPTTQRLQ